MRQKRFTVSVGIAAYNEESNIRGVLRSICRQAEKSIKINEILVVSDGSSDNTVQNANGVGDGRIKTFDRKDRKGKPTRVNEILEMFNSHALIIIDADMILKGKYALENLIRPIRENNKVGLVAGNATPLPGQTQLERGINNYIYTRDSLAKTTDFESTAFMLHAYLAYSKKFTEVIRMPKGLLNDDAYSFFFCKRKKFICRFAKDSVVYYRSARHIREYIKQTKRHISGGMQLYKYFGEETVKKGFRMPADVNIRLMIGQILRNPLGYLLVKVLYSYCMFMSKHHKPDLTVQWQIIGSTKQLSTTST